MRRRNEMKPAQGLRQKKNAQVKQALYDAALELFRQKGFDETSVDEITGRAGYSRATFFNHFSTKQGVLRYYGQKLQDLVEALLDQTDPTTPALELIRQVIFAMAREAKENLDDVKLICTHSVRDPNYLSAPTPARKRLWEILTELVSEAQQQRQIRQDLSARELALHILFLYQGVVLAILTGMGSTESLLHSVWQFILTGVKSEDSSNQ
jgi:AcrR family transcriptional regulator